MSWWLFLLDAPIALGEGSAAGSLSAPALAQPEAAEKQDDARWRLIPHASVQLLATGGAGEGPALSAAALRAGVRLEAPWLEANLELLHDRLPLSPGAPTQGPELREARVTFHLPGGPRFTLGAFRPLLGRESLTPRFKLPSADKALAQGPLRHHLAGRRSGVAPGVNLGEMVTLGALTLRYDLGLVLHRPEVGGDAQPALLVGRVSLTRGDPEQERYALTLPGFDPERPGLSVALEASVDTSGRTGSIGVELLQQGSFAFVSIESHLISDEDARTLASSARGSLSVTGPGSTRFEPYVLLSHVWRSATAAGLEAGAGLAWWLDTDRLRVSGGATSTLLQSDGPRADVNRLPRVELLFQRRF